MWVCCCAVKCVAFFGCNVQHHAEMQSAVHWHAHKTFAICLACHNTASRLHGSAVCS